MPAPDADAKVQYSPSFEYFLSELEFMLSWPGESAETIARWLGVKDVATVERRFERNKALDHPLLERFRRRRPGYCSECRLSNYTHRDTCSQWFPILHNRRPKRAS